MDVFSIVSTVVIIASLTWSAGVLLYALIKRIKQKRKLKRFEQEVLTDENSTVGQEEIKTDKQD